MKRHSKPIALITAAAFGLSACATTPTETSSAPQNTCVAQAEYSSLASIAYGTIGLIVLGGAGGSAGAAGAGFVLGGLFGAYFDNQAADLEASLADTDLLITNEGNRLIVTLPNDILFETGSAVLSDAEVSELGILADSLNCYPDTTLTVVGHTDNVGSDAFNMDLSQERARGVATALAAQGVLGSRISTTGMGESSPVASNDTAAGRAQNRRVDVVIDAPN